MAIRTPAAGHGKEQRLGRIRKSATDLPKVLPILLCASAGMRIATPVCALARNDMLKTDRCQRGQGRLPTVIARSEATWQSVLLRQHIAESCA